jgi:succinoglycan biosynthesis protein ExoM
MDEVPTALRDPSERPEPMIETSIIIPTYNRADCLVRAIRSCLTQRDVEAGYEIVVVDNNPDGSAATAVAAITVGSPVPIRYVAEPRPGISHARNTAIAAARGRYLAFLDDDQEAEPGWLAAHLSALRRYDADIVFGPFHPRFEISDAAVPPYARGKYTRDENMPTGSPMPARSPLLGSPGISNTLIARERCLDDAEPFRPALGFAGGEDTLLFRQLLRRGCKMVWCAEARVRETIPAERLTTLYLLRRAFNNGQISASTWGALDPPARGRMLLVMAAGIVQAALFALPAMVLRLCNHPRWLPFAAQVAGGLGKIFCHPRALLPIYRTPPAHPHEDRPGTSTATPRGTGG